MRDLSNFAEREAYWFYDTPTVEHCRQQGRTHRAYGWCPKPGNWPEAQLAAYQEGFACS